MAKRLRLIILSIIICCVNFAISSEQDDLFRLWSLASDMVRVDLEKLVESSSEIIAVVSVQTESRSGIPTSEFNADTGAIISGHYYYYRGRCKVLLKLVGDPCVSNWGYDWKEEAQGGHSIISQTETILAPEEEEAIEEGYPFYNLTQETKENVCVCRINNILKDKLKALSPCFLIPADKVSDVKDAITYFADHKLLFANDKFKDNLTELTALIQHKNIFIAVKAFKTILQNAADKTILDIVFQENDAFRQAVFVCAICREIRQRKQEDIVAITNEFSALIEKAPSFAKVEGVALGVLIFMHSGFNWQNRTKWSNVLCEVYKKHKKDGGKDASIKGLGDGLKEAYDRWRPNYRREPKKKDKRS